MSLNNTSGERRVTLPASSNALVAASSPIWRRLSQCIRAGGSGLTSSVVLCPLGFVTEQIETIGSCGREVAHFCERSASYTDDEGLSLSSRGWHCRGRGRNYPASSRLVDQNDPSRLVTGDHPVTRRDNRQGGRLHERSHYSLSICIYSS